MLRLRAAAYQTEVAARLSTTSGYRRGCVRCAQVRPRMVAACCIGAQCRDRASANDD